MMQKQQNSVGLKFNTAFSLEDEDQDQAVAQAPPAVHEERIVKLRYKSCCGCGCSHGTVTRTVPHDSTLKDGDKITKMLDEDTIKWD